MKQTKDDMIKELMARVDDLAKEVAALKEVRVTQKKESTKGKPRANVKYAVLKVPAEGFQPQALTVMKILAKAPNALEIAEPEAYDLICQHKSMLNTTQDPWRIFQYYRPRLIEADCLRMQ